MTANENKSPIMSDDDIRDLKIIAEMIIPTSDVHKIPGAADPEIFEDILSLAAPHTATIASALKALNALSLEADGEAFAKLGTDQRETVADSFRQNHAAVTELLEALTVQAYYRNERIKSSLDMESRPPFPGGFTLEQGDWSLLDEVRSRPPFYRGTSN
jgi:hypothetical protein